MRDDKHEADAVEQPAKECDGLFEPKPVPGPRMTTAVRWRGNAERLVHDCYQKYLIQGLLRRKPLPPSKDGRHIPLRADSSDALVDERRDSPYLSNSIRSSRYTVWDFLPKQFFFQATRLSNFYFICIGVPQTIPGLSTTGNYTTILPLMFFMILTIIKEGYDDYRRHRLDALENNYDACILEPRQPAEAARHVYFERYLSTLVASLRSALWMKRKSTVPVLAKAHADADADADVDVDSDYHWTTIKWKDVRVGNVMRLRRDEAVPADIVLLSATGETGIAYIDTMALDGETNLKSRQAPDLLKHCHNIAAIKTCDAHFVSEDPNRNLYEYNGRVSMDGTTIPLTLNEIIYRGSVLRNTDAILGIVINTGEECKIRQNANHHPKAKKPRLEHYSNQVVLTLIAYVVILSIGVSMGYILWHNSVEVDAWYLNDASVPFKEIIIGFLIMFNNVIPLALYISLEIVKIGQMLMIHSDVEMHDADSNTSMSCNTNTILENLGQVSYILSDKTGTLTENVMRFRKMSIAGVAWSHGVAEAVKRGPRLSESGFARSLPRRSQSILEPPSLHTSARPSFETRNSGIIGSRELSTTALLDHIRHHPSSAFSQRACDFLLCMALCHTALPECRDDGTCIIQASSPDEVALVEAAGELGLRLESRTSTSITLVETAPDGSEQRRTYRILDMIEFNSHRKRMSIIVQYPDGRIRLLCKGADSAIAPRLLQATLASRKSREVRRSIQLEREARRSGSLGPRRSMSIRPSLGIRGRSSMDIRPDPQRQTLEVPKASFQMRVHTRSLDVQLTPEELDGLAANDSEVFSRCFRHLDRFATDGLRTLLFAHRDLTPAEYKGWRLIYQDAATALTDRQERIDAAGEMIEQGLELLGATAIEDKLQKGVPETIESFRRANVKLWMLTGDKRETAINIAYAARICRPESDLYTLDGQKGSVETQLRDIATALEANNEHTVIVVDGHTLGMIEVDYRLKAVFYRLISLVDSVVGCRASPSQKADIVKAIRSRIPGALTLAIGDGANDIAMIQASHVGVGISGKEGLQAARVADYSIAQFRFLQRLLLVHGRWSYIRTAKFILMTFWKEQFFYMMQALYQRYNGYTGTSLYENWSLTVLNTLFTSLCVIVPGIFEQDLRADTLLAVPELYAFGPRNRGLNLYKYLSQITLATVQGIIVWFVAWAGYGVFNTQGDNGLFALGDLCFSLGIVWTNVSLLVIDAHCKTLIVGISFIITVGGWWAWNGFMASVYSSNLSPYDVRYGFTETFGKDPNWWLTLIVALAILTTLEAVVRILRKHGTAYIRTFASAKQLVDEDPWAEALNVGMWQEMEQDPVTAARIHDIASSRYDGRETTMEDDLEFV